MAKTYPVVRFNEQVFSDEDIINCTVVEEFDPLSGTLPISTAEVELYTENAEFSVLNPFRDVGSLARKQPMDIYVNVEGVNRYVGLYYLDEWENTSNRTVKFKLIDQIGYLDEYQYDGNLWITPTTVGAVMDQISFETGIEFQVDPDLRAIELRGWIPICTYREAIQQIAFACSAYVLTAGQQGFVKMSRISSVFGVVVKGLNSGVFKVGQSRLYQRRWRPSVWALFRRAFFITNTSIGVDFSISRNKTYSNLQLEAYEYRVGTTEEDLYSGYLEAGEHRINFDKPHHSLAATGASIVESHVNYVIISTLGDDVTITGKNYEVSVSLHSKSASGVSEGIAYIKDATLVNLDNVSTILDSNFQYYQNRLEQKSKIIGTSDVQTGDLIKIKSYYNQFIKGFIEQSTIDLVRGYTSDAVIVGDLDIPKYLAYCGVLSAGQSRVWSKRFRTTPEPEIGIWVEITGEPSGGWIGIDGESTVISEPTTELVYLLYMAGT